MQIEFEDSLESQAVMRGSDLRTGELFSYVDLEQRVPESHPLRLIRCIVNQVLAALDCEFGKLYAAEGRPSIAPERLLRALLHMIACKNGRQANT